MPPGIYTGAEKRPLSDEVGYASGTIIAVLSFVFLIGIAIAPDYLIWNGSEILATRIIATAVCLAGMTGGWIIRRANVPK